MFIFQVGARKTSLRGTWKLDLLCEREIHAPFGFDHVKRLRGHAITRWEPSQLPQVSKYVSKVII